MLTPNAGIPMGAKEAEDETELKTLYANRPLKNGADIVAWARKAGFKKTLAPADMHVTIAFSKIPLSWPATEEDDVEAPDANDSGNGTRSVQMLGGEGAIALRFESPDLAKRWQALRAAGASWDYPSYAPHVTFTLDAGGVDLSSVSPYPGALVFGPEEFQEIGNRAADWAQKARDSMVSDKIATDSALRLALDRESVRSFDEDGRMRVAVANISKAQIRPYSGREIPGWDEDTEKHALSLDPDKVYKLACLPEELEKAAPTFNGVQLLKDHKPVDAEDHQKNDIIGCTGTDCRYEHPYLKVALSVWTKEGIEFIESEERRELSSGYHYDPDMTPGVYEGETYDGVMRNIRGNHVVICEEGRAGPDVLVGDSLLELEWAIVEDAIGKLLRAA